jgi:hypothetical protein
MCYAHEHRHVPTKRETLSVKEMKECSLGRKRFHALVHVRFYARNEEQKLS